MWKYSILVSYVGSDFCGWQKQKAVPGNLKLNKPSIQSTIEDALFKMSGERVSLVGSGRTDAGVHAIGQVAHFVLKTKNWPLHILQRGLNGILPIQIRILTVQLVALDFHAQRSALKKQYSYYFQQGACALPFLEPFSWWIQKRLNTEAMSEGIRHLVGTHDFKPFQSSGSKPGPTVRTILEADVTRVPVNHLCGLPALESTTSMELVRVRVLGTGFLKQMVRGIAGTLLQVGEDRRPSSCFPEILQKLDRSLVGPTAPARALWLEQVWYSDTKAS